MIDFLRTVFLESVVLLLILEVAAVAIVLGIHRRHGTTNTRLALWATLIVCIALLVVQHLVKTDREQIVAAVSAMARAVDDGDVPTLGEYLAADFQDREMDKAEWLSDIRQRLQRWRIDEARTWGHKVEVNGDEAVVTFQAMCDWRSGEQSGQSILSTWKLGMARRDGIWTLHRVISAKIGPGGAFDYSGIMQY
ncbi:MAG TPA: nuclear transport factor 2 family protein [Phycisphaerae bacterium]|nr:nuclear transport factor 2 family protein [Phycisphaerae bacterium]HOJ74196.1 nuclear transport factor 2 family protein [Phycisphaerae bacterium]HOM51274.1 nuclear transport factor 2 family protein [Phycisphaerae bacterium]HON67862.1 nuclear transport factor 2 family protein [Phycisphaerae bacterium]HOQ84886.1 nuclear transport factor 2 family protein [Phycisphaerae bacterium]